MAQKITITVPDNCELQKNGNSYTIVEKEKLSYEDIAKELFSHKDVFWITERGLINRISSEHVCISDLNNCTSQKQAEKLLAINKLMNVAKYINGNWQPDWNNEEGKYYIQIENISNNLNIDCTGLFNSAIVYFKSEELARQAIEILGEKTIKLALCTDY